MRTLRESMNKKSQHKKTLQEVPGVKQPEKTNVSGVKSRRKAEEISVEAYIKHIRACDISWLSKAITLVESQNKRHAEKAQDIVKACLPFSGNSIRIGITGVPGVGKSTFIEAFGNLWTRKGKKVAVLAVDPTSSIHKGSILGDKTRMETLVRNPDVFIRPSASGDSLGGVARKTRESIVLCEAAGFDVILIETVGVGQGEVAVHSMVDFFLLLKLAGAGDELQGIKRGIIEMADAIVINKADGDNISLSELAKTTFENALHLYPEKESGWTPKVLLASSVTGLGIEAVYHAVMDFIQLVKENRFFEKNRKEQEEFWLYDTIETQLKHDFYAQPQVQKELIRFKKLLAEKSTTPYEAASKLLEIFRKDKFNPHYG